MSKKYTSILFCVYPEQSNVYINGISLAIVKGDTVVELSKINPLELPESAFSDISTLRSEINSALDKVEKSLKVKEELEKAKRELQNNLLKEIQDLVKS